MVVETPEPKARIMFAEPDRGYENNSPTRIHRRKRESKIDFDIQIKKKQTVIEDLEGGDFFNDDEELSEIQENTLGSKFG